MRSGFEKKIDSDEMVDKEKMVVKFTFKQLPFDKEVFCIDHGNSSCPFRLIVSVPP